MEDSGVNAAYILHAEGAGSASLSFEFWKVYPPEFGQGLLQLFDGIRRGGQVRVYTINFFCKNLAQTVRA